MSDIKELKKQIADMQSTYTHQQEVIDSLNDTVIKQWEAIDTLAKIVNQCVDQISSVSNSLDGESADPPPPHY